jgi:hypothetical protein
LDESCGTLSKFQLHAQQFVFRNSRSNVVRGNTMTVSEESRKPEHSADEKASVTLPGTVEKIVRPADPDAPEKAQISVEGAADLYREIRIDNTLQDATGEEVGLKPGAEVDVTIEADKEAVRKKK